MLSRLFASILSIGLLVSPSVADGPIPPKLPPIAPVAATANLVPGLELPADQTVSADDGFVSIKATCIGEVKWIVLGATKFMTVPQANTIIISIPHKDGAVITAFAIGIVDGKLTDFARTNITVGGGTVVPPPNPNPNPVPVPSGKLHVTFIVDMNSVTPQMAQLLNSKTLAEGVSGMGNWFRLYDVKNPIVSKKKLDVEFKKVGGTHAMIIQNSAGDVVYEKPIPATEDEIFNIIRGIK